MTHITIERAKLALADATQSAMTSHNSEGDQVICIEPHLWKQLREAIQALAAQPAPVKEPFGYVYEVYCLPECAWEMDWIESFDRYEPDAEDNIRNVIPLYTTPPAQQAVPDAITDNSESPEYRTGWNDCRAEMLKGMKP
jgi:hypothetical protein